MYIYIDMIDLKTVRVDNDEVGTGLLSVGSFCVQTPGTHTVKENDSNPIIMCLGRLAILVMLALT